MRISLIIITESVKLSILVFSIIGGRSELPDPEPPEPKAIADGGGFQLHRELV